MWHLPRRSRDVVSCGRTATLDASLPSRRKDTRANALLGIQNCTACALLCGHSRSGGLLAAYPITDHSKDSQPVAVTSNPCRAACSRISRTVTPRVAFLDLSHAAATANTCVLRDGGSHPQRETSLRQRHCRPAASDGVRLRRVNAPQGPAWSFDYCRGARIATREASGLFRIAVNPVASYMRI
jgi:hypothetical protein